MSLPRKAYKKAYYRSGGPGAPEAKNTAPGPTPARSIAGFAPLKSAGTSGPTISGPRAGMGHVGAGAPRKGRMPGGTRDAGPGITKTAQGTNCPKRGKGPTGLGRSGSMYPPIG